MKYADQLFLMCSGEKGVSHRGFRMIREPFNNQDEMTGGMMISPIQDGLGDDFDNFYLVKLRVGTLFANQFATNFSVQTTYKYARSGRYGVMGFLQEGRHILRQLSKLSSVMVRDCGVLIQMNPTWPHTQEEDDVNTQDPMAVPDCGVS